MLTNYDQVRKVSFYVERAVSVLVAERAAV